MNIEKLDDLIHNLGLEAQKLTASDDHEDLLYGMGMTKVINAVRQFMVETRKKKALTPDEVYKRNHQFLADKGLVLKIKGDTGLMLDTEKYYLHENEFCHLYIVNKQTQKNHSVCMISQLLKDSHFE